ncbi:hypothetical protein [Planosporangium thailandense]|uniref:hypothetical protein n=1 Tax=Planosporangium thailandense TaxID=765197 RepID=UPI001F0E5B30|nr:hypothetical protein [Planosporangium thailandense]
MLFEVFDEDLDRLAGDLVERGVAEAGQDVVAQMAAVGRPLGRAGDVAGFPDGDPFGEGDPAEGGVEVGVEGLFDLDLLAAQFGGGLGGVPGVGADGAVGEPVPDAVAGGAFFYPGTLRPVRSSRRRQPSPGFQSVELAPVPFICECT